MISLFVNRERPITLSHHFSPLLPLYDKLAFPVISALGIVVCSVRWQSLCAADRTRTVSLCLIVPVSGFLFIVLSVQVLIAAALICCFQDASGGAYPARAVISQHSLVHTTRRTRSQCFHRNTNAQGKMMNLSIFVNHRQHVHSVT